MLTKKQKYKCNKSRIFKRAYFLLKDDFRINTFDEALKAAYAEHRSFINGMIEDQEREERKILSNLKRKYNVAPKMDYHIQIDLAKQLKRERYENK